MSQDTSRFDTGCVSTARRVSHAYRGFSFCLLTMGLFYFSPFERTLKSVTQGSVPPSEIFVWGAYFYNKTREPLFRGSNGPELPIGRVKKKSRCAPRPAGDLISHSRFPSVFPCQMAMGPRDRGPSKNSGLAAHPTSPRTPTRAACGRSGFFRVCFMLRPGAFGSTTRRKKRNKKKQKRNFLFSQLFRFLF
jgi:hypothetical protein